ncbi:hypothetical protein T09_14403 [Trichinella sp. T9]|nr:hypothetical protein T09_14403 [Trichinella sp. T9]
MYRSGRHACKYADTGLVHSDIASLYIWADKQWTCEIHTVRQMKHMLSRAAVALRSYHCWFRNCGHSVTRCSPWHTGQVGWRDV